MKYAKFSDEFLSDFRLDDSGETLVLTDKRGYTRAVKLLPCEEKSHGEWIADACPKCGVSKYNFFTVVKGANGERSKPFGTWNYCPKCGADLRGKKVEGE